MVIWEKRVCREIFWQFLTYLGCARRRNVLREVWIVTLATLKVKSFPMPFVGINGEKKMKSFPMLI